MQPQSHNSYKKAGRRGALQSARSPEAFDRRLSEQGGREGFVPPRLGQDHTGSARGPRAQQHELPACYHPRAASQCTSQGAAAGMRGSSQVPALSRTDNMLPRRDVLTAQRTGLSTKLCSPLILLSRGSCADGKQPAAAQCSTLVVAWPAPPQSIYGESRSIRWSSRAPRVGMRAAHGGALMGRKPGP